MANYKKVLVAIDLLGSSDAVLSKAQGFVERSDEAYLVNVAFNPSYFASYVRAVAMLNETTEALQKEQESWAEEKIKHLQSTFSLEKAKILVTAGKPEDVILDHAKKMNADLIIVGSHGQQSVSLLLGSTANSVLHRANCDVLTVRV